MNKVTVNLLIEINGTQYKTSNGGQFSGQLTEGDVVNLVNFSRNQLISRGLTESAITTGMVDIIAEDAVIID